MKKYIATEPLFVGRHRAANAGDEVPEENIEPNGWQDKVQVVDDDAPAGASVKDILAEVGDDPGKAQAALDAEKSRGDDARSTLVAELEKRIAAADPS